MRILFTGVGRRIELIQAFRQAALALGKQLTIYGADISDAAPALAYCDYSRKTVPMKDAKYIDSLLKVCERDRIDLIIPTIDTDLLILSKNVNRFKKVGTRVLISASDMVYMCRNKNITSEFFSICGLNAPIPVNNWEDYRGGYPAFIKPKDGSSSINAYKVNGVVELENLASKIRDYIIQPFITGKEYTIDICCDWHGIPVSIVPRERLQVRSGEVLVTRIDLDEQMINESKTLCARMKPVGPITVQLIRDAEGTDWFIEINPRFGGGVPLSMKAGARSAEAILQMVDNEHINREWSIANHSVYSRFDQSVCVSQSRSVIRGVIFDLDDTLYSEKEYIRSGYRAVSDYLQGEYSDILWRYFNEGKAPIDELLHDLNLMDIKTACLKAYREHMPNIHLYDGVRELIKRLKAADIRVGIITDGRPGGQRKKLAALGLEKIISDENIIITDELGGAQFRKPCDIAFRIIQNRWNLNPSEIAYVGDNPQKDFQAPIHLGMQSIYYKNLNGLYYKEEFSTLSAVEVVSSIEELTNIILSIGD